MASLPCMATSFDLDCPKEYPQDALQVPEVWMQWTPQKSNIVRLSGVSFYDSHPSQRMELAPSLGSDTKLSATSTWLLNRPFANGKWFSCDYNNGTLGLARQLPDAITKCTVKYAKEKAEKLVYRAAVCQ